MTASKRVEIVEVDDFIEAEAKQESNYLEEL